MTHSRTGDLKQLPKAHLHVHFEGAMRLGTLQDLAQRHGQPVAVDGDGSFASFIALYRAACEVLRHPDDYDRLISEVVQDATDDGAVWIEISSWISPDHATRLGLPNETAVLETMLEAGKRASQRTGLGVGFILSANRARPAEEAVQLARLAARYAGQGVVGFGLADDETRAPPELFTEAFAIARGAGLLSVPHAGEHAGPESVRSALDQLGAQRIMHGVRAIEDPDLVARLADEQINLDVCPTSNVRLRVVSSFAEHPLPKLLAAGVPVSLNADDPLFFSSGILAEYEVGRERFGLDDSMLAHIARCSIRASGAPASVKSAALAGVDRWLGVDPG